MDRYLEKENLRQLIAGIILITLVTLIPVIYKKIMAKKGGKIEL